MIVVLRPPLLSTAVDIVTARTNWPRADVMRPHRLEAIDRALDEPWLLPDADPQERVAWQLAAMCQQLLQLDLPEGPRVTEALLHRTVENSGIRPKGDRLSMVLALQGWARSSRDLRSLADLMDLSFTVPAWPDPGDIDWQALIAAHDSEPVTWDAIMRGWTYRAPTYYLGDLSGIPQFDGELSARMRRAAHILEGVVRRSPRPTPVALARELSPIHNPRINARHRPPRRPDAHIVLGTPEQRVEDLDALHAAPVPSILLDANADVELARWTYATYEDVLAAWRRRMNQWVLSVPRLSELSHLVTRASDRGLRSAAHRSGVSVAQMLAIVDENSSEQLGDISSRQMARLLDSLRESGAFANGPSSRRPRSQPRMRYAGLRQAARRRGWDDRTVTRLYEAAKREFAATGTEHRLDLLTDEDWIAFYDRLYGDH